jgi:hypothetical protein
LSLRSFHNSQIIGENAHELNIRMEQHYYKYISLLLYYVETSGACIIQLLTDEICRVM